MPIRSSIWKSILGLAAFLSILCASRSAQAQIPQNLVQLGFDSAYVYNGSGNETGLPINAGTQVTAYLSVDGVSNNNGTTYVSCYASNSVIYSNTITMNINNVQFTWTPSAAGTYIVSCRAQYTGTMNGVAATANITVVVSPPLSYPGFLNPKYIVVGVTYAPPGPSSFVQYTGTTSVGNTSTVASSFANDVGFSISVKASISGWGAGGAVTGSASTDYTQGSSSSTTNTLSKLTSLAYKTMGTGNAFSPVDSDYDTIWLWLNPVVLLTYTPATSNSVAGIQWNGYGYDATDPSGEDQPDIYPVQVGWLNGHFGNSSSVNTILARGWVTPGMIWPAGQGPGLTSTDIANIIAADPLTSSSYTLLESFPSTTSDGRFTMMEGSNSPNPIAYDQAGPGNGGGLTTAYNTTQTDTQSVAEGTTSTFKQVFGMQEVFAATIFGTGVTATLKQTDTLTWTNSWLNTLNTTTTLQDSLSVTGPNCPAAPPGPCNPVYAGPGQFLLYQDNQYGTFLFYPSN